MSKRPNIVVFVAEDLDFEGLNCYNPAETGYSGISKAGNGYASERYEVSKLLTPTIDALARDGVLFNNYYCTSAICTPARYTLLTGKLPERSKEFCENTPPGTQANIWFNTSISATELNLAKVLKKEGYRTGIVGKWHNWRKDGTSIAQYSYHGNAPDADPFDPVVKKKIETGYAMAVDELKAGYGFDFVDRIYFNNPEPIKPTVLNSQNIDWIVEGALNFLDQQKDSEQPFFLYVAITLPHGRYSGARFMLSNPLSSPAGLLPEAPGIMPSRKSIIERVRAAGIDDYGFEGLWLDDSVNAILKRLETIRKRDDTCFVFTTDHPTAGKGTTHLGRIPCIIQAPWAENTSRVCNALLSQTDLAPTLLDLAGLEIPAEMLLDAKSFAPLVVGETRDETQGRRRVLLEVCNSRAVVAGGWKYIANRLPSDGSCASGSIPTSGWHATDSVNIISHWGAAELFPAYFDADQLYDLRADPLEQQNVAATPACREKLDEMKAILREELNKLPHVFGEFTTSQTSEKEGAQ